MRHIVLTRSAFGPAWDLAANARRLAVTRAVTARLMAAQTTRDWTWLVLLDPRDPLLAERMALYEASAPHFQPLVWPPPVSDNVSRVAAADYRAPWREAIGPVDDTLLMTRLDDDDGLAVDAIERYQRAAVRHRRLRRRTVLMLPYGVRVWAGRYSRVHHNCNAMHTLVAPPGDRLCVYDYSHVKSRQVAACVTVDARPGWLWVRHRDTLSGYRQANAPLTAAIRELFPVDWAALEANWAGRTLVAA